MAVFDSAGPLGSDLAYRLMRTGPVCLFWRLALLEEKALWLGEQGYQLVRMDAVEWHTEDDMHDAFATALDFPDYYGRNLDALNDCLRDVDVFEYGATPGTTGLVLILTGYDAFTRRCPRAAHIVLDIVADHSRTAMLLGHRLLALVQTDDPDLRFEPVGATTPGWNAAEWLNSSRRA
jgi:hypothetical protein